MAYTYRHFRKDTNEIFYVGIGKDNDGRFKRAYETQKRNKHWYNIVNKVGFYVDIVADMLTWEEACEMETKLIKEYGRKDLNEGSLVNMTNGGDGNTNPSLELRETARARNIGKVLSSEHKQKISESLKGHSVSDKTKERLKEVMKYSGMYGKTHSEETKQKMSKARIGIITSDETKQKQREAKLNNPTKYWEGKSRKGMKQIHQTYTCPHCEKIGKGSAMFKWHFDNCKQKVNGQI